MSDVSKHGPSAAGTVLSSGLQRFHDEIERNCDHARKLASGLADEAFHWRTGPDRWSVAQCFEHLDVTMELYFAGIDAAIEKALARGWRSNEPPRNGWLAAWFISLLEPPPRRRFKAPGPFAPSIRRPLAEALPRFLEIRQQLVSRLRRADRLDLRKAKLRSPAVPLLRFSLAETFGILNAHDRRHLWQAEQVRQAPGFPGI